MNLFKMDVDQLIKDINKLVNKEGYYLYEIEEITPLDKNYVTFRFEFKVDNLSVDLRYRIYSNKYERDGNYIENTLSKIIDKVLGSNLHD